MYRRIVLALLGVLLSITVPFLYRKWNDWHINEPKLAKCLSPDQKLYTAENLAQYTNPPTILLAFLGVVYDVSSGHYYHPGGAYGFFAGKDGTRAFLTGEFTTEELRDDIDDLDDTYLNGIETWVDLYEDKYKRKGVVIGSYYDQDGCPTKQLERLSQRLGRLKRNKQKQDEDTNQYPPCNSQWDVQTKSGKVWCTNLSGGISRQWIGRPRLFYDLHTKSWRCACVPDDDRVDFCHQHSDDNSGSPKKPVVGVQYSENSTSDGIGDSVPDCRFKYYDGCPMDSVECQIKE